MTNDKKKLVVPLASGNELVAEISSDGVFPDTIFIYVRGKETGLWLQDIVAVTNDYEFDETIDSPSSKKNLIRAMVYTDEQTEDYSDIFQIRELNEEDELIIHEELM